jgi:hypothetical protein
MKNFDKALRLLFKNSGLKKSNIRNYSTLQDFPLDPLTITGFTDGEGLFPCFYY